MKKTIILIASIIIPIISWGQAQINTKKVKISDFTQKVTKVVLTGSDFMDSALTDEIASRWRVSPYEFCTMEEFENTKTSDEYYFLISTTGQFKKEASPSIRFLTLVKGGPEAEGGIDKMLEVVSLPISSAEFPSGREMIFLSAFLDIIQNHALKAMEKDINAYGGLANTTSRLSAKEGVQIIFSTDDIYGVIDKELSDILEGHGIVLVSENEADELYSNGSADTIVSYVVSSFEEEEGSYCYKMLIDSQNHELYYFKRHRISAKNGKGFLPNDLKRICSSIK